MSKSLKLLSETIAQVRQHIGLFKSIMQEAKMASTKIVYNPFRLDMFERDEMGQVRLLEYHKSPNPAIPGSLNNAQRQTLDTVAGIAKEIGFEVCLGEIDGNPGQSTEVSIPLYISIDAEKDHHLLKPELKLFVHQNEPFPDFTTTIEFFAEPGQVHEKISVPAKGTCAQSKGEHHG
jgi:hypothetical protein